LIGNWHRYYYCRNHDPLRAGGEQRRYRNQDNARNDQFLAAAQTGYQSTKASAPAWRRGFMLALWRVAHKSERSARHRDSWPLYSGRSV